MTETVTSLSDPYYTRDLEVPNILPVSAVEKRTGGLDQKSGGVANILHSVAGHGSEPHPCAMTSAINLPSPSRSGRAEGTGYTPSKKLCIGGQERVQSRSRILPLPGIDGDLPDLDDLPDLEAPLSKPRLGGQPTATATNASLSVATPTGKRNILPVASHAVRTRVVKQGSTATNEMRFVFHGNAHSQQGLTLAPAPITHNPGVASSAGRQLQGVPPVHKIDTPRGKHVQLGETPTPFDFAQLTKQGAALRKSVDDLAKFIAARPHADILAMPHQMPARVPSSAPQHHPRAVSPPTLPQPPLMNVQHSKTQAVSPPTLPQPPRMNVQHSKTQAVSPPTLPQPPWMNVQHSKTQAVSPPTLPQPPWMNVQHSKTQAVSPPTLPQPPLMNVQHSKTQAVSPPTLPQPPRMNVQHPQTQAVSPPTLPQPPRMNVQHPQTQAVSPPTLPQPPRMNVQHPQTQAVSPPTLPQPPRMNVQHPQTQAVSPPTLPQPPWMNVHHPQTQAHLSAQNIDAGNLDVRNNVPGVKIKRTRWDIHPLDALPSIPHQVRNHAPALIPAPHPQPVMQNHDVEIVRVEPPQVMVIPPGPVIPNEPPRVEVVVQDPVAAQNLHPAPVMVPPPVNIENHIDVWLVEIIDLLPDADIMHVREQLIRFCEHPAPVNAVVNAMLENGYPRKVEQLTLSSPSKVVAESASELESESDSGPEVDYYQEYTKDMSLGGTQYHHEVVVVLRNDFLWVPVGAIRRVLGAFKWHYAPVHRCFTDGFNEAGYKILESGALDWLGEKADSQQGKSPAVPHMKSPSMRMPSKISLRIPPNNHQTSVGLLKQGRKRVVTTKHKDLHPQLRKQREFVWKQTKAEKEESDSKLAQQLNEVQYEETGQLIECGCCYCESPFESMVQCMEGHLFCMDCLRRYAEESIFGQGKADLSCMTTECDATFPKSQLVKAVSGKILKTYEDRVREEALNMADMEDLVRCPYCAFAAVMDPGDKVFKCQEPSCMKETCRFCKEDWKDHFGIPCEELEKKDETKMRVAFEEKMTKAMIRTCHRCKASFQKIDGCNKMTCRCGAKQCYICRKPDIDYNHFCPHLRTPGKPCSKCTACSLWMNAQEDDALALKEIEKEAESAKVGRKEAEAVPPPNKKQRV